MPSLTGSGCGNSDNATAKCQDLNSPKSTGKVWGGSLKGVKHGEKTGTGHRRGILYKQAWMEKLRKSTSRIHLSLTEVEAYLQLLL